MRSRFISLAAVCAAAIAAGCQPEANVRVFISDAEAVIAENKALDIPIQVRVPALSDEKCAENTEKFAASLSKFIKDPVFKACSQKEMYTYAAFEGSIPMVRMVPNQNIHEQKHPFFIAVRQQQIECDKAPCESTLLAFVANDPLDKVIAEFARKIPELAMFASKSVPVSITLTVDNDTRQDFRVIPEHGFLNDRPAYRGRQDMVLTLGRRKTADIRISDVAATSVSQGEDALVGFFYPSGE